MFPTPLRLNRTLALALLLGVGAIPSAAQDAAPPTAAAGEQLAAPAEKQNSPEALATAARNILELIEVHRFRMGRIDAAIAYYQGIGENDNVRQFQLLREREEHDYQQTLETYRRMLGDADFTRVVAALRDHLNGSPKRPDERRDDANVRERRDALADGDENAAERAERVRRLMAAQASEARERADQAAAYERSQAIARARASQRVQLAQRLQQARAQQLEARAAAARRYQPPTQPPVAARPGPAGSADRGGAAPAAAAGATPPAARPTPRPSRP